MVERPLSMREVGGSIPSDSTALFARVFDSGQGLSSLLRSLVPRRVLAAGLACSLARLVAT
jgi:hypothetical protein